MKKIFLLCFLFLIIILSSGCNKKENSNNNVGDIEPIYQNMITNEEMRDKYYELLSSKYNSFAIFECNKEDGTEACLSKFSKNYFTYFYDIDNDNIDEMFLFNYYESRDTEITYSSMETGSVSINYFINHAISLYKYDESEKTNTGIENITCIGSHITDSPLLKSSDIVLKYKYNSKYNMFVHELLKLDAIEKYHNKIATTRVPMDRYFVEDFNKKYSFYDKFYVGYNLVGFDYSLYFSGNGKYSKVTEKEIIDISKNEYDEIVNKSIPVTFYKIDSSKIKIDE